MKKNEQNISAFYTHLGKLFYAVALADKKLDDGEFGTLKKELSNASDFKELLTVNESVDVKDQILSAFTLVFANKEEPQTCYDDFVNFKKTNEELFTEVIKKEILTIAGKIASSFSNRNKSELIILAKLSLEFDK